MTDRRPVRRSALPLPAMLGGLFSRTQSARAAQLAIRYRGLIPSQPGPRDWSPGHESAKPPAQPGRQRRPQPQRMPAAARVANYAQCGRSGLTGAQIRRVMRKNGLSRAQVTGMRRDH